MSHFCIRYHHCSLILAQWLTTYAVMDPMRHQTKVDFSSVESCPIHLKAITLEMRMKVITRSLQRVWKLHTLIKVTSLNQSNIASTAQCVKVLYVEWYFHHIIDNLKLGLVDWHYSPVASRHKGQWSRSFDAFFELRLNKRLVKQQSRRRWFETPSRLLWRHCNAVNSPHKGPVMWKMFLFYQPL